MKVPREQVVDAQVLAFWRARSVLLDDLLAQESPAEQSWFWTIQRDIVRYLLDRYGDGDVKTPTPKDLVLIKEVFEGLSPANLEVRSPAVLTAPAGHGKSPRPAADIRPVLSQIATVNLERYEQLDLVRETQRQIRLREKNRLFNAVARSGRAAPMGLAFPDRMISATAAEPLVDPAPEMLGVSDAEIADILSGDAAVEPIPEDAWDSEDSNPT